jgi:hypothetical protein
LEYLPLKEILLAGDWRKPPTNRNPCLGEYHPKQQSAIDIEIRIHLNSSLGSQKVNATTPSKTLHIFDPPVLDRLKASRSFASKTNLAINARHEESLLVWERLAVVFFFQFR